MPFFTKKYKDFLDFKLICRLVYSGAHMNPDIKALILKLSRAMNDFRLSSNSNPAELLTNDERETLIKASPGWEYLLDVRTRDILTKKIVPRHQSCIYEVINISTGEEILAKTLIEAAQIVGVVYKTLKKYLDVEEDNKVLELKGWRIKRIAVFLKKNSNDL